MSAWKKLLTFQDTPLASVKSISISADVATLTAARSLDGVCFHSVLLGIDCKNLETTCCYVMDEGLDGAVYNASRRKVATWKENQMLVFDTAEPARMVPIRRCHSDDLSLARENRIHRVEWAGSKLVFWTGPPGYISQVFLWADDDSPQILFLHTGSGILIANFCFAVSPCGNWLVYGASPNFSFRRTSDATDKNLSGTFSLCFGQNSNQDCLEYYAVTKDMKLIHEFYPKTGSAVKSWELPSNVKSMLSGGETTGILHLSVVVRDEELEVWLHVNSTVFAWTTRAAAQPQQFDAGTPGRWFASPAGLFAVASNAVWAGIPSAPATPVAAPLQPPVGASVPRSVYCIEPGGQESGPLRFSAAEAVREAASFHLPLLLALVAVGEAPLSARHVAAVQLLFVARDRTSDEAVDLPFLDAAVDADKASLCSARVLKQRLDEGLQAHVPVAVPLVLTEPTKKIVARIMLGIKYGHPVLLEGEAAAGKTATVQFCAHATNSPLLRFNLTPTTTIADFVGSLQLEQRGEQAQFVFQLGPLSLAAKDGYWLLLDEANLATDAVLRVIEQVESGFLRLSGGAVGGLPGAVDAQLTIPVHPNFRLFIAQNPANDPRYGATRNVLSVSMQSHFVPVQIPSMDAEGIRYVVETKLRRSAFKRPEEAAAGLVTLFADASELIANERSKHLLSLRDLLQAVELITEGFLNPALHVVLGIKLIFTQKLQGRAHQEEMQRRVDGLASSFRVEERLEGRELDGQTWPDQQLAFLPELACVYDCLDIGRTTGRPVLLCGAELCGKASAVRKWLLWRRLPYLERSLTPDVTAEDLFGRVIPTQERTSDKAPFRWEDGPVTEAMKKGLVLLLRGLNEPDASVLESLNAVLEVDRSGKRYALVAGKHVAVKEGFFVVATTCGSQHALTPSLASRFLAYQMPQNTGEAGLRELMLCYVPHGKEWPALLIEELKEATMRDGRCGIGEVSRCMKALRAWWEFWEARGKSKSELESNSGNAVKTLAKLVGDGPLDLANIGNIWPVSFDDVRQSADTEFTVVPSREQVMSAMSTCVACRLAVVLEGDAGVGKTAMVEQLHRLTSTRNTKDLEVIHFSANTTLDDIAGHFVPEGSGKCSWKDGPLYRSLREGSMLLCDELNLAPAEVLAYLAPLLSFEPGSEFKCPISGQTVKVSAGFALIAAQNPPSYQGRKRLPRSLVRRMVQLQVPVYTKDEAVKIVRDSARRASGHELDLRRAQLLLEVLGYQSTERCKVTLRHVLKLLRRLTSGTWADFLTSGWEELVQLHATILFPDPGLVAWPLQIEGKIEQVAGGAKMRFQLGTDTRFASVELDCDPLPIQGLDAVAIRTLCRLAFCFSFKEPCIVAGPSCFKTHCVRLLANGLRLHPSPARLTTPPRLTTIFLSQLSETSELLGGIEPHTQETFLTYLRQWCKLLQTNVGPQPEDIRAVLSAFSGASKTAEQLSYNERWCRLQLLELEKLCTSAQGFPFCERGVVPCVRFGGVLFLKDLNLPDQAVVEGLNSLTELRPSLRSGPHSERVEVHPDLWVVASLHEPNTHCPMSPAVISRFTLIHVEPAQSSMFQDVYSGLVENYLISRPRNVKKEHCSKLLNYIFGVLNVVKETEPSLHSRVTLRKLLRWCDYLLVSRASRGDEENQHLEKLALGAQVILLDEIESVARRRALARKLRDGPEIGFDVQLHEDPSQADCRADAWLVPGQAGRRRTLRYWGIEVSGARGLQGFVPSFTSVRNLARILTARYTGHIVNLVGPPGVGKSAIAEKAAGLLGMSFVRISCSSSLTMEDLFGSYGPVLDEQSARMVFVFQEGVLAKAMNTGGHMVLFDEINLAPAEVLSALCGLFSSAPAEEFCTKNASLTRKDTIFICAMNPPNVGGGRQELPPSLQGLLTTVQLLPLTEEEVDAIVSGAYRPVFEHPVGGMPQDSPTLLETALKIHRSLVSRSVQYARLLNLRTLQNLAAIIQSIDWHKVQSSEQARYLHFAALSLVYASGDVNLREQAELVIVEHLLSNFTKVQRDEFLAGWRARTVLVTVQGGQLQICPVCEVAFGLVLQLPRAEHADDYFANTSELRLSQKQQRQLEMFMVGSLSGRVLLLEGPACSGKTALVQHAAGQCNRRLVMVSLNMDVEVSDLLGGFVAATNGLTEEWLGQLCLRMNSSLDFKALLSVLPGPDADPQLVTESVLLLFPELPRPRSGELPFMFVPGPVLQAMRRGCWLLLDNIDAARPEVVERLNSLGEADSALHLFEHGSASGSIDARLKPHPDFRCFATATTKRSSGYVLSEAFRNRCIIMQCEALDAGLDGSDGAGAHVEEMIRSVCESGLQKEMVGLHRSVLEKAGGAFVGERTKKVCGYEPTFRSLKKLSQMMTGHVPLEAALEQVYDTFQPEVSVETRRRLDLKRRRVVVGTTSVEGSRQGPAGVGAPTMRVLLEQVGAKYVRVCDEVDAFKTLLDMSTKGPLSQQRPPFIVAPRDAWQLQHMFGHLPKLSVEGVVMEFMLDDHQVEALCTGEVVLGSFRLPLRVQLKTGVEKCTMVLCSARPSLGLSLEALETLLAGPLRRSIGQIVLHRMDGLRRLPFHKYTLELPLRCAKDKRMEAMFVVEGGDAWQLGVFRGSVAASLSVTRLKSTASFEPRPGAECTVIKAQASVQLDLGPLTFKFEGDGHSSSGCVTFRGNLKGAVGVPLNTIGGFFSQEVQRALPCSVTFPQLQCTVHVGWAVPSEWSSAWGAGHAGEQGVYWKVEHVEEGTRFALPFGIEMCQFTVSFLGRRTSQLNWKASVGGTLRVGGESVCKLSAQLVSPVTELVFRLETAPLGWPREVVGAVLQLLPGSELLPQCLSPASQCTLQCPMQGGDYVLNCCFGCEWQLLAPLGVEVRNLEVTAVWGGDEAGVKGCLQLSLTVLGAQLQVSLDIAKTRSSKYIEISSESPLPIKELLAGLAKRMFAGSSCVSAIERLAALSAETLVFEQPLRIHFQPKVAVEFAAVLRFSDWFPLEPLGFRQLGCRNVAVSVKKSREGTWEAELSASVEIFKLRLPKMSLQLPPPTGRPLQIKIAKGSRIDSISLGSALKEFLDSAIEPPQCLFNWPVIEEVEEFFVLLQDGEGKLCGDMQFDSSLSNWRILGDSLPAFELKDGRVSLKRESGKMSGSFEFTLQISSAFQMPFKWQSNKSLDTVVVRGEMSNLRLKPMLETVLSPLGLRGCPNIVFHKATYCVELSRAFKGAALEMVLLQGNWIDIEDDPILRLVSKILWVKDVDCRIVRKDGRWDGTCIQGTLKIGDVVTPRFEVMLPPKDGRWRLSIARAAFPPENGGSANLLQLLPFGTAKLFKDVELLFKEMEMVAACGGSSSAEVKLSLFDGRLNILPKGSQFELSLDAITARVVYDQSKPSFTERFAGSTIEGSLSVLGMHIPIKEIKYPPTEAYWKIEVECNLTASARPDTKTVLGHFQGHADFGAMAAICNELGLSHVPLSWLEVSVALKGKRAERLSLKIGVGRGSRGVVGQALASFGIRELSVCLLRKREETEGESLGWEKTQIWLEASLDFAGMSVKIDFDLQKSSLKMHSVPQELVDVAFDIIAGTIEQCMGQIGSDAEAAELLGKLKSASESVRAFVQLLKQELRKTDPLQWNWDDAIGKLQDLNQATADLRISVDQGLSKASGDGAAVLEIVRKLVSDLEGASATAHARLNKVTKCNFNDLLKDIKIESGHAQGFLDQLQLQITTFELSLKKKELLVIANILSDRLPPGLDLVFTCCKLAQGWSWMFGAVFCKKVKFADIWDPLQLFDRIFDSFGLELHCPSLFLGQLKDPSIVKLLETETKDREMGTHYFALNDKDTAVMKAYPKLGRYLGGDREALEAAMQRTPEFEVVKRDAYAKQGGAGFFVLGLTIRFQPDAWFWKIFALNGKAFCAALVIVKGPKGSKDRYRLVCPLLGADKLGELSIKGADLILREERIGVSLGVEVQLPTSIDFNQSQAATVVGLLDIFPGEKMLKAGLLLDSEWRSPFGMSKVTVLRLAAFLTVKSGMAGGIELALEGMVEVGKIKAEVYFGYKNGLPSSFLLYMQNMDVVSIVEVVTNSDLAHLDWLRYVFPQNKELFLMLLREGASIDVAALKEKFTNPTHSPIERMDKDGNIVSAEIEHRTAVDLTEDGTIILEEMCPGGTITGPAIGVGLHTFLLDGKIEILFFLKATYGEVGGEVRLKVNGLMDVIEISGRDGVGPLTGKFFVPLADGKEPYMRVDGRVQVLKLVEADITLEITASGFLFDFEMDLLGVFKIWYRVLVDFKEGFKLLAALGDVQAVHDALSLEEKKLFCIETGNRVVAPSETSRKGFGSGVAAKLENIFRDVQGKLDEAINELGRAKDRAGPFSFVISACQEVVHMCKGVIWLLERVANAVKQFMDWIESNVIEVKYIIVGGTFYKDEKKCILVKIGLVVFEKDISFSLNLEFGSCSANDGSGTQEIHEHTAKKCIEEIGSSEDHGGSLDMNDLRSEEARQIRDKLQKLEEELTTAVDNSNSRQQEGQPEQPPPPVSFNMERAEAEASQMENQMRQDWQQGEVQRQEALDQQIKNKRAENVKNERDRNQEYEEKVLNQKQAREKELERERREAADRIARQQKTEAGREEEEKQAQERAGQAATEARKAWGEFPRQSRPASTPPHPPLPQEPSVLSPRTEENEEPGVRDAERHHERLSVEKAVEQWRKDEERGVMEEKERNARRREAARLRKELLEASELAMELHTQERRRLALYRDATPRVEFERMLRRRDQRFSDDREAIVREFFHVAGRCMQQGTSDGDAAEWDAVLMAILDTESAAPADSTNPTQQVPGESSSRSGGRSPGAASTATPLQTAPWAADSLAPGTESSRAAPPEHALPARRASQSQPQPAPMRQRSPATGRSGEYARFAKGLRPAVEALLGAWMEGRAADEEDTEFAAAPARGRLVVDSALFATETRQAELVCAAMELFHRANCLVEVAVSGALEHVSPHVVLRAGHVSAAAKAAAIDAVLGGAVAVQPPARWLAGGAVSPASGGPVGGENGLDFVLCIAPHETAMGVAMPLPLTDAAERGCGRVGFVTLEPGGAVQYVLNGQGVETLQELLRLLAPPRLTVTRLNWGWQGVWFPWARLQYAGLEVAVEGAARASAGDGVVWGEDLGGDAAEEGAEEMLLSSDAFEALRAARLELPATLGGQPLEKVLAEAEEAWDALERQVGELAEEVLERMAALPPTHFERHSTGSRGKLLSVPGLLKWFVTQGSTADIWLKRDRGGRRRYCVCLVLDLTPSNAADPAALRSLFALLPTLAALQLHVQVVAFSMAGVFAVKDGGPWDAHSKLRLLWALAAAQKADDADVKAARSPLAEALLLAVQLLRSAAAPPGSLRDVWLFTAGAADVSPSTLRAVCGVAQRHSVGVKACSLSNLSLRSLGIPVWFTCCPTAIASLAECLFKVAGPQSPPAGSAAVPAAWPLAVVGRQWQAPIERAAVEAAALTWAADDHVFLSAFLDYSCQPQYVPPPITAAPPPDATQPPPVPTAAPAPRDLPSAVSTPPTYPTLFIPK